MFEQIPNTELTQSNVPLSGAGWVEITSFALTFDGYDFWGSFAKCAGIGNEGARLFAEQRLLPATLTELRTCLFFEQRRYHHFGESPDETVMQYIRALINGIREKVRARDID